MALVSALRCKTRPVKFSN